MNILRRLLSRLGLLTAVLFAALGAEPAGTNDPGRAVGPVRVLAPAAALATGEYHLLAIGVDSYLHWPKLQTAVRGAHSLTGVLTNDYGFTRATLLLNADATRPRIEAQLRRVAREAGTNDSVLIYFAGHGHIDEQTEAGSWIPAEGRLPDPANAADDAPSSWLRNAEVKAILRTARARHILLVSDSCFAGDFLRTYRDAPAALTDEGLREALRRPSRQVLAAGGLEPVLDQGGGDQSVFTGALLRTLREPAQAFLLPYQLHGRIADTLLLNARQKPQLGQMHDTGAEVGGEFVFLRRSRSLDDTLAERQRQQAELARLAEAAAAAEAGKQAEIKRQQDELARIDAQIAALKRRLQDAGDTTGSTLDELAKLAEQKQKEAEELARLREQAAQERQVREAEIARLKAAEVRQRKTQFEQRMTVYRKVADSPYLDDAIKAKAWLALCTELGGEAAGQPPGQIAVPGRRRADRRGRPHSRRQRSVSEHAGDEVRAGARDGGAVQRVGDAGAGL